MINTDLEYWRQFYKNKQKHTKDRGEWVRQEGENAAFREMSTRHNDEMQIVHWNMGSALERMNQTAQEMTESSIKWREGFGKDLDLSKYLSFWKD